jgi:predicted aspartyl protease
MAAVGDVMTVALELHANKPRSPVRVNGEGPFDFLIDTGSIFDLVDTERAAELGIVTAGEYDASGAGEATMNLETADGVRLALDGLELPPQEVRVAPINEAIGRFEGRRLDGLLGYDFFSRFGVELDYVAGTLAVGREPRGEAVPLPITRRHPFVRAAFSVGGRRFAGEFLVDTGFRSALVLASPFVAEHGLVGLVGHTIEATTSVGIGGPTVERVGRIERLELGPFVLENVVVSLSQARSGTLATHGFGGIVGSEILRRFTGTFDYPQERLLLEHNAHLAEPFEFDLSGLYFVGGDGIQVFRVLAGSPAAEAGIREGDRVITDVPLDDLRSAFRTQVGTEHTLELERDGRRFTASFRLRRMV